MTKTKDRQIKFALVNFMCCISWTCALVISRVNLDLLVRRVFSLFLYLSSLQSEGGK